MKRIPSLKNMTAKELWRLFERKEKVYRGQKHFFEKWVHDESRSGIIFYSTLDERGKTCYVVEGYGIGTIDTKTFTERSMMAPIQRSCHYD
jgi:hypothetical protein